MTPPTSAFLTSDQLAVLHVVARMDLSPGVAIGLSLGRPVTDDLAALRAQGHVREVSSPRYDGTPSHLNTITAKGTEALGGQDGQSVSAPMPTVAPRPPLHRETYTGSEMRPFTGRAGSMDALKYPSRIGDHLRYRDDGGEPARKNPPPPRKT